MSVNKITDPVSQNDVIDKINEVIDNLGSGGSITTWYGTCSTGASTAVKEVVCSGFTLALGAIIVVSFSQGNTAATPKLNVNSTGDKSIYVGNGTPNATTNTLKWTADTWMLFVYDGAYFRYIASRSAASIVPPDGAGSWYGTSSTPAETAAKASSITNYRLMKGARVSITFTTANTVEGALTLNVNSTGAKTIYLNSAATSASNPLLWDAGETLTFVYSGSNYYFIGKSKLKYPSVIYGNGSNDVSVSVNDDGISLDYINEEEGAVTSLLIADGVISAVVDDGVSVSAFEITPTTTWETPTITDSSATIVNGGYYTNGHCCHVQMRVQLTANLNADSGRNILSGLPVPKDVNAAVLSILANNRGGHGARVTNAGALQIIADVDHGINSGQNIDLTGVYIIS